MTPRELPSPTLSRSQWFTAWSLLFASFFLWHHEWTRLPDGRLHVNVLDVGQGDAILITTPGYQRILVDGGPDLSVLERLGEKLSFFDRRIDLLVLSHTDSDHLRAFPEVLKRYDVQRVLLTGVARETSTYQAFLEALDNIDVPVVLADADHDLDLGGGLLLDVLWPSRRLYGENVKDPNDASIVAKLTYRSTTGGTRRSGDREVLLTGDISAKVETELLKQGYDLHSDILKIPHHGSRTSSSTGFLLAVDPELAVVSVGQDNTYGHPHPSVVARYASLGIPLRSTAEEGSIELTLE